MSDFKKKLIREVVEPAQKSAGIYTFTGTIKESKKNSNKFLVAYTDENGNTKEETIKVDVNYSKFSGGQGFEKGDQVYITKNNKNLTIIGRVNSEDANASHNIKYDVFSNGSSGNLPGTIF